MKNDDDPALLEITDLAVRYDGVEVLQNISLGVRRGEFASIIGPNGAGKSTLLKAVMGLVPRVRGEITIRTGRIGYVPQQLALDRTLPITVSEFLSLRLDRTRFGFLRGAEHREQVMVQLREVGAEHLVSRKLGRLSGGEFQRVLIGYALLDSPELLLLDEPFTGIDIRGGLSFDGLLHHLHEHRGMTVLMVSHDLHLVQHLSDTVFCLNRDLCCHGRARDVLKPENLARAYGHIPGMVTEQDGIAFIPMTKIH